MKSQGKVKNVLKVNKKKKNKNNKLLRKKLKNLEIKSEFKN